MSKTLFGFDIEQQWDYENGFYLTSHLTRIPKMLAHYELYKSIINLPGQVVECGPEFLTKSAIDKHRSLTGSGFEQSDRRFPQPTVCCQILS